MSIYNEEEFKLNINEKYYLINISIIKEQLSLVLTLLELLIQPPKQYSGFFSLLELRIVSKIFLHAFNLFEAKELIKRAIIKEQISIKEDDHRATIIFDTPFDNDSIPFHIILFRDLSVKHLSKSQSLENYKKLIDNNNKNKFINNKILINNKNNEINYQNNFLKTNIYSNTNNKILINNNNFNNNEFNKTYNFNNNKNGINSKIKRIYLSPNININKDNRYCKNLYDKNKQILNNIYYNMKVNNNIKSSFYNNLKNSFNSLSDKKEKNFFHNKINNLNNNINLTLRYNNSSNNINQSIQSFNNNRIIFNPKRSMNSPKRLVLNNSINNFYNIRNSDREFLQRKSFKSSQKENNKIFIPNNNNINLFNLNKNISQDIYKNKRYNTNHNSIDNDCSEESNNEGIINNEDNKLHKNNYYFKNLVIKIPKIIKGNIEKFKKFQNMGDYIPSGAKFVSYLKFPETKSNINSSCISTLSSSIISSVNRIPGIEKNVINHPAELDEITSRIKRLFNKKHIKFKLIYRGTEHGDLSSTFHEKCDKYNNTLILIHTSDNKRFGGFTTQAWDGEDVNKKDDHCFIFSIDKMRVYDIIKGKNAIHCNPGYGPVFVDQIKLLDNYFIQGGSTSSKGKTFQTLEDYEITDGAEKFGIKEVEVYHII